MGESEPQLKNAVYEWSRAGYIYARALQRGKKLANPDDKKYGETVLKDMDKDFEKLPAFEGPLSRDLAFDDWDEALKAFKPGNTYTTEAYESFTASEGYHNSRKCRLVIEKNTRGRAAWGLCQTPDEAEVLVPKGQKYEIVSVEENLENGPPFVIVHLREA